jgi:oligopeptide transport system substrate-binding protein
MLSERRPSWGEGEAAYSRLELGPLSKRATRALVGEVLSRVPQLPDDLRELVVDGSEGNPFCVEELTKMLIEDGVIVRGEDRWEVLLDRLASVRVPPSLTAVLQARLDGLSPEEKAVLQRASVVGREFWDQAVAELAVDAIARDEVVPMLSSLRAKELVYRRERSAFAGTQEYTFKHSVLRDVAYETVLLKVRQRYHGQVAAWLEAHAGERLAEYYGVIAAHYELAGDAERALDYLTQAGDRARSLGAYREAAADYERALAILRATAEVNRTARLLMKLGLTYHSAFEFDQARQAFEDGFVLRQRAARIRSQEAQPFELRPAPHPLRLASPQPRTIDPAHCVDMEPVTDQIFSGLVTLTPDLSVEPDVALRWEVLDGGRRYVFHLRDDVVWSDGVPVTASDFEYAWKRVLDPATGSAVADFLYDIRGAQAYNRGELLSSDDVGVHAQDEQTLVVELEGPTSYLPQLLTNTVAFPVPRHVVQLLGDEWREPDRIVTNGAFRLTRWDRGGSIVLDRSPSYHGHFPGNVRQVVISTESARSELALYEEDSLDMMRLGYLLPAEEDQARQRHADEYISIPQLETFYVGFDAGRLPFDDPRVRRAFALATDRTSLAEFDQTGVAFPATGGLVPPGVPGHSPRIGLPYDPERARLLLAEAGFPGGRNFPEVEWLDHDPPGRKPVLLFLQASWMENLGVRVEWTFVPWDTMMDRLYHTQPPHLWLAAWVPDYVDPDNFLRVAQWKHSGRWRNREYDELIEAARCVLEPETRLQMYRQADRIVVEEAPVVPLTYRRRDILAKPWVRFPPRALGRWYYKDFTIEPH